MVIKRLVLERRQNVRLSTMINVEEREVETSDSGYHVRRKDSLLRNHKSVTGQTQPRPAKKADFSVSVTKKGVVEKTRIAIAGILRSASFSRVRCELSLRPHLQTLPNAESQTSAKARQQGFEYNCAKQNRKKVLAGSPT